MPQRRYFAPLTNMWNNEQDPADIMAQLQQINEAERLKDAQRALAAIQNPDLRRPIGQQQGMFGWGSSTFGMTPGLTAENRARDQSVNNLLGTARAISDLTGKTQMMTVTNALPDTVNGIGPGGQRRGTEGAAQQNRINQALDQSTQREGFDLGGPSSHDRPQLERPFNEQDEIVNQRWKAYRDEKKREIDDENRLRDAQPASGYARDDTGRTVPLPSASGMDETLRREQEYQRNYDRNRAVIEEEERRRRQRRGY